MAWREALAKAGMEELTVESAVAKVRLSKSVGVNLSEVLVMGGGDGVATLEGVFTGGGGTKGEAKMARGGVGLRSAFFYAGDEEAEGEWVARFFKASFLEVDLVETCFSTGRGIHNCIPVRFRMEFCGGHQVGFLMT